MSTATITSSNAAICSGTDDTDDSNKVNKVYEEIMDDNEEKGHVNYESITSN